MADLAGMSLQDRLGGTLRRALPHLALEVRRRVANLVNPSSLGIIAGVLVAWVASHAFGVGEAIDVILAAVGIVSIGLAVFTGLDELWDFANGVYHARDDGDLETAARHFARAVSILGIEAVLAVLFRGRPRTQSGRPVTIGAEPPHGPGLRARPATTGDPHLPAGSGATDAWGNITYSLRGNAQDQALALAHERIHQILTPKLYVLRRVRVQSRMNSYFRSSLSRYLEEALAETAAQVQARGGIASLIEGVRFPVGNGYVHLRRGGGYSSVMGGRGVLPEGGALIGTGTAAGMTFTIWFQQAPASSVEPAPRRPAVVR